MLHMTGYAKPYNKKNRFIENYIIECNNNFDIFYERYRSVIDEIDIENLEIVAFQVTSNSDECSNIKNMDCIICNGY